MRAISALLSEFLDTVIPRRCPGCERPTRAVTDRGFCAECAALIPGGLWPLPITIQGARSARVMAPYDGPVGAALRRGKYRPDESVIRALAERLSGAAALPGIDLVVPVPQDPWTTWRRGFSPVWILAGAAARAAGVPRLGALARAVGPAQASLPTRGRRDNARRVFSAKRAIDGTVLLVDDVVTTGATAAACTSELLQAGARRVEVLALTSPRI